MEHLLTNQSLETSSKLENFVQYLNQVADTDDPDNMERIKALKMKTSSMSSTAEVAEFKNVIAGIDNGSVENRILSLMDIATGTDGAWPSPVSTT